MAYVKRQNLWIAGLLATWGASAAAMAAMKSVPQFLALRVLLGAFEAGAVPGLSAYLAHFYCKERLAMPMAVMMGAPRGVALGWFFFGGGGWIGCCSSFAQASLLHDPPLADRPL